MKSVVVLAVLLSASIASGFNAPMVISGDCQVYCTGGGGGPCDGVYGDLEIDCGSTRCSYEFSVGGNGGEVGTSQGQVSASDTSPITACTSDPNCCMDIYPCSGSDWGDVGSGCEALCSDCYV